MPPDGGSLVAYLESLRRVAELDLELICPGHGPWITDPAAKVAEYIEHRLDRERKLVDALESGERSRAALLDAAWDDVPAELRPAAAQVMQAHLEKLEAEGRLPGDLVRLDSAPMARRRTWGRRRAAAARRGSGDALGRDGRGRSGRARRRGRRGAAAPVPAPPAAPTTRAGVASRGSRAPVEIRRDRWGVPHIRAETAEDLWFAEGYCHGQDRLWQMELYRLSSSGRISEIAGEAGLPSDRLMRTLGLRRAAEREAAALDAGSALPARGPLRRGQRGGRRGASAAAGVPGPPPRLRPVAARGHADRDEAPLLRALDELGARADARRHGARAGRRAGGAARPRLPGRASRGHQPRPAPGTATASRSPSRSPRCARRSGSRSRPAARTTGRSAASEARPGSPLIAGDPHLPPSMPGIFYQVDLELDGRFARGASLPGVPGINMGQTNDVAFTFTNAMADVDGPLRRADRRRPLRVRGRVAAGRDGRARRSGSRAAPSPSDSRSARRTTARSSTPASAPTTPSRSPCAGRSSTCRRCREAQVRVHEADQRRRAGGAPREHATPGLEPDLGRPPRPIGYKTVGRDAGRGAATAPTCRSRAGPASTSGRVSCPTRRCRQRATPSAAT